MLQDETMRARGVALPYLRRWRHWHGLTQEELSRMAGVATYTIGRLEVGATHANSGTVAKLAEALGIDRATLINQSPQRMGWPHVA